VINVFGVYQFLLLAMSLQ